MKDGYYESRAEQIEAETLPLLLDLVAKALIMKPGNVKRRAKNILMQTGASGRTDGRND